MDLTMKAEIPEGEYLGRLTSVEEWTQNAEKYGPAVRFAFEILKGDYKGQEAVSITSAKVTKKTRLGKLLRALKGSAIEPGEMIDPTQFIGREYVISVVETDSGSTRVENLIAPTVQ